MPGHPGIPVLRRTLRAGCEGRDPHGFRVSLRPFRLRCPREVAADIYWTPKLK